MLRPVGPQPPSVYWRRRLILLASVAALVVLITLTVNALRGGSGSPAAAGETTPQPSPSGTSTGAAAPSSTPSTTAKASGTTSGSGSSAPKPTTSSAKPPPACTANNLKVIAVVGQSTYAIGADPKLELQVANTGATPCVQDLADKQVELRVYNGESRVWGSHDCKVLPGTDLRTLAPRAPVVVSLTWSGLTSSAGSGCTPGSRQRVGAGTYTLYASLAGHNGTAAQFTIS